MATDNGWASADDWEEYLNSPEANQPAPDDNFDVADLNFASEDELFMAESMRQPSMSHKYMVMFVPVDVHYYMPDGNDMFGTEIVRVGVN